jgi:endonuclease/exonuclease/phosphatase family metal-dependent hydrolase
MDCLRSKKPWEELHVLINEQLVPHFAELAKCHSSVELHALPLYQRLDPAIETVLASPQAGDFTTRPATARSRYRFLAWNLARGVELDGQLEAFNSHEYLKTCDVLLLTETDLGMARSNNRDVAQTIARELGFHYVFAPCYLNLSKGSGVEHEVDGDNELGLHGNALLSRYPIHNVRLIRLPNGIDKMSRREKRIGSQAALVARIDFPHFPVTAASVHLDANSTQRHRRDQLAAVLDALPTAGPVILGGDWNTTTFNSSTAFHAIMGYWLRVFMGPDNVIRNHYLHPYRRFEKQLFALLDARGFDYRLCNRLGEYTICYDISDLRAYKDLAEWVPHWCFAFIRWALRNHRGRCPLKLDWFATRVLRTTDPVVIHDLREGRRIPLSDHDAIGVDVLV